MGRRGWAAAFLVMWFTSTSTLAQIRFCNTDPEAGEAATTECKADPPLEQQLNTANSKFRQGDKPGALDTYLRAFDGTPYRPVGGVAHGFLVASLNDTGQYERAIQEILRRDRLLARDDYKVWSDLAIVANSLAQRASSDVAETILDGSFRRFPASKLRSRVWALVPVATSLKLLHHIHALAGETDSDAGTDDADGPKKPQKPTIKALAEAYIARNPGDPFLEFAYYLAEQYEKGLAYKPGSVISDVLRYAIGFREIKALDREMQALVSERGDASLAAQPMGALLPGFAARAAAARPHLEAVLRDEPLSPHRDDAAFWLGWLAYHDGKETEALRFYGLALTVGNGDYAAGAVKAARQIQQGRSVADQVAALDAYPGLRESPALWYVAARTAYRQGDYRQTQQIAERALVHLHIPLDKLPATTDPVEIASALRAVLSPPGPVPSAPSDSQESWQFLDPNLTELPYLLQASKELSAFEAALAASAQEPPERFAARARAIVAKYSVSGQRGEGDPPRPPSVPLSHLDPRQALRLIDATLARLPPDAVHAGLREWLHYRKVRLLVGFAPKDVPAAAAAMEREFPAGNLTDDALAEQLFVETRVLDDLPAARRTFRRLTEKFPRGNALDNGYNWMAIALRCGQRQNEARGLDRDIIRRFPLTRHAYYAVRRLATTTEPDCGGEGEYGPRWRTARPAAVYRYPNRRGEVLIRLAAGVRVEAGQKSAETVEIHLGRSTGYALPDDLECYARCPSSSDSQAPDGSNAETKN